MGNHEPKLQGRDIIYLFIKDGPILIKKRHTLAYGDGVPLKTRAIILDPFLHFKPLEFCKIGI